MNLRHVYWVIFIKRVLFSRIQDLATFWTSWDCRSAEPVRSNVSSRKRNVSFWRVRDIIIWFSLSMLVFFHFRWGWHGSRRKHFWHLQLRPSRLFGGGACSDRDWRRQSSHQHREETGKEQEHRRPHSQIRSSWRMLVAVAFALLHRLLTA